LVIVTGQCYGEDLTAPIPTLPAKITPNPRQTDFDPNTGK
jgi:hypothetical protein